MGIPCLYGIFPDLVLTSQTPFSKLLKFQNKQQKEEINFYVARFAIGLWLSWNRLSTLLVNTAADFPVSLNTAGTVHSSLYPSLFSPGSCPPSPLGSHKVGTRWYQGWSGGAAGRALRPGVALSASPRGSHGLGEPWIRRAKSSL